MKKDQSQALYFSGRCLHSTTSGFESFRRCHSDCGNVKIQVSWLMNLTRKGAKKAVIMAWQKRDIPTHSFKQL